MCCARHPSGPEAVGAGCEGKERFGESHIRPEEPSPPHLQKISQKEKSFRGEREILREGAQSLTICRQNSRKARRLLHAFKRAGKAERSPRHALGKSCFMPKWGAMEESGMHSAREDSPAERNPGVRMEILQGLSASKNKGRTRSASSGPKENA